MSIARYSLFSIHVTLANAEDGCRKRNSHANMPQTHRTFPLWERKPATQGKCDHAIPQQTGRLLGSQWWQDSSVPRELLKTKWNSCVPTVSIACWSEWHLFGWVLQNDGRMPTHTRADGVDVGSWALQYLREPDKARRIANYWETKISLRNYLLGLASFGFWTGNFPSLF